MFFLKSIKIGLSETTGSQGLGVQNVVYYHLPSYLLNRKKLVYMDPPFPILYCTPSLDFSLV